MLRAQRTLHSNRLRRKRLDHRSDILSAALAGHHEIMNGLRPLKHDHIIGEEKENNASAASGDPSMEMVAGRLSIKWIRSSN
jgi:hypothetical protein